MTTPHTPESPDLAIMSELDPEKLELVLLRRDVQDIKQQLEEIAQTQTELLKLFNAAQGLLRVVKVLSLVFGVAGGLLLLIRHAIDLIAHKGTLP